MDSYAFQLYLQHRNWISVSCGLEQTERYRTLFLHATCHKIQISVTTASQTVRKPSLSIPIYDTGWDSTTNNIAVTQTSVCPSQTLTSSLLVTSFFWQKIHPFHCPVQSVTRWIYWMTDHDCTYIPFQNGNPHKTCIHTHHTHTRGQNSCHNVDKHISITIYMTTTNSCKNN